jgi:AcrR family transcriptional regulator
MTTDEPKRRPGGRSARVQAAVRQAVRELTAERGYGAFTVGDVAQRAGVADTSIYRRWGTLEALLMEAVVNRLTVNSPLPSTGSLDTDLRMYAAKVAADISGPDGLAVLRTVAAALSAGPAGETARDRYLAIRADQIDQMLARARARGEKTPTTLDILDVLLAPMYIRVLFGAGPLTPAYVNVLVDRLLSL